MRKYVTYLAAFFLLLHLPFLANAQEIVTIVGGSCNCYNGDGIPATSAKLNLPWSLCFGKNKDMYIADMSNHRIRKIDSSGIIWTFAGTGEIGYLGLEGEGGPATAAKLYQPAIIAIDKIGNIFFANEQNNWICRIDTSGILNKYAGGNIAGYTGDGGPASSAKLYSPGKIVFDSIGNLYFADVENNCIRKIDSLGVITTIVGSGLRGFSGDGGAARSAKFYRPHGFCFDRWGNLYIADSYNNRVRKVDNTGTITTIAGNDTAGFSGDGGPSTSAKLYMPNDIAVDRVGNVFISDCYNSRIRKINPSGIISTVAGTTFSGFNGDGPAITSALYYPGGIMLDSLDNLYIADQNNSRIRTISFHKPSFCKGDTQSLAFCYPIDSVSLDSNLEVVELQHGLTLSWSLIQGPLHGVANTAFTAISTGDTIKPLGLNYIPDPTYIGTDSLKVAVNNGTTTSITTVYLNVRQFTISGTITGFDHVCAGDSILLSDSVANGQWSCSNNNATISLSGTLYGVIPGIDTVWYSVISPCGIIQTSREIRIDSLPTIAPIIGPDTVYVGESYTFVESLTDGIWSLTNSYIASMSSDGSFTGVNVGVDTIFFTASNEHCKITIEKFVSILSKQIKENPGITLYPNVTTGLLTVQMPNTNNFAYVEVFDINGNNIYQTTIAKSVGQKLTLDFTDLPKGTYFIRIVSGSTSFRATFKLL